MGKCTRAQFAVGSGFYCTRDRTAKDIRELNLSMTGGVNGYNIRQLQRQIHLAAIITDALLYRNGDPGVEPS
jgi:hypothetical protein